MYKVTSKKERKRGREKEREREREGKVHVFLYMIHSDNITGFNWSLSLVYPHIVPRIITEYKAWHIQDLAIG